MVSSGSRRNAYNTSGSQSLASLATQKMGQTTAPVVQTVDHDRNSRGYSEELRQAVTQRDPINSALYEEEIKGDYAPMTERLPAASRKFDTRMSNQALAEYACDTLGVVDEDDVSDGVDSTEEAAANAKQELLQRARSVSRK